MPVLPVVKKSMVLDVNTVMKDLSLQQQTPGVCVACKEACQARLTIGSSYSITGTLQAHDACMQQTRL